MWAGPLQREYIEELLNTRWWLITNLFLTIIVLTADDLLVAFLPKDPWDAALQVVFVLALCVFLADLALQSARDRRTIFTLFWWLDLLASASMLLELTFITSPLVNALGIASGNDTSLAQAGRAARAGSRIGRLLKLLRVLRLVRVFRLFKMLRENPCVPEASLDEDDDFLAHPSTSDASVEDTGSHGHKTIVKNSAHAVAPKRPFAGGNSPTAKVAPAPSLTDPAGGTLRQQPQEEGKKSYAPVDRDQSHASAAVTGVSNGIQVAYQDQTGTSDLPLLPAADSAHDAARPWAHGNPDQGDAAAPRPQLAQTSATNQDSAGQRARQQHHQDRLDRAFAAVHVARVTEGTEAGSDMDSGASSEDAERIERQRRAAAEELRRRREYAHEGPSPHAGAEAGLVAAGSEPGQPVAGSYAQLAGSGVGDSRVMRRRDSRGRNALRKIGSKYSSVVAGTAGAAGTAAGRGAVVQSAAAAGGREASSSIFSSFFGTGGTKGRRRKPPRMKSALNQLAVQAAQRYAAQRERAEQRRQAVSRQNSMNATASDGNASNAPAGPTASRYNSDANSGGILGSFLGMAAFGFGQDASSDVPRPRALPSSDAAGVGISGSGAGAPRLSPIADTNSPRVDALETPAGSSGSDSPQNDHPADDLDALLAATEQAAAKAAMEAEAGETGGAAGAMREERASDRTYVRSKPKRWSSSSATDANAADSKTKGKRPAGVEDSPLAGELFRMRRLEDIQQKREKKARKEKRRQRRASLASAAGGNASPDINTPADDSLVSTDSDESKGRQDSESGDSFVHKLEKYAKPHGGADETAKAMTKADGGGVGGIVSRRIRLHVMLGVMLILLLLPLLEYTVECDEELATIRSVDDVAGSALESKLASHALDRYPNMVYFAVHGALYVDERQRAEELRSYDVLKVALPSTGDNQGVSSVFAANISRLDINGNVVENGTATSAVVGDWPIVPIGLISRLENETAMWLDVSASNRAEAIWSFGQTHVIIVLLGLIAALLNRDVEQLLVRPIERIKQHLLPVRGDAIRWLTLPNNKWSVSFGAEDGESLDTKIMIASVEVLRLSMKRRARRNFRNMTVLQGLRRGSEHFGGVKTLFKGMRRSSVAAGVTPAGSPQVAVGEQLRERHNRRPSLGSTGGRVGRPSSGAESDGSQGLKRIRSAGSVLKLARKGEWRKQY